MEQERKGHTDRWGCQRTACKMTEDFEIQVWNPTEVFEWVQKGFFRSF